VVDIIACCDDDFLYAVVWNINVTNKIVTFVKKTHDKMKTKTGFNKF